MRTVFFIPPLSSLSGGLAAIYELAAILLDLGYKVAVTCPSEATPGFNRLDARAERLSWPEVAAGRALGQNDLWCVPEGWPNAVAPGVNGKAKVLVYVQNWIHLLNTLPAGVRWKRLPVRFLSVSGPVSWFMRKVMELESAAVLPPAIADFFFSAEHGASAEAAMPGQSDQAEQAEPPGGVARAAGLIQPAGQGGVARGNKVARVAWMPRKNKALAMQMREIALNVLARDGLENSVEFVEIAGKSREEVAALLAGTDIFLSTGFPEGFALPPLEAMACGAVPVGFTGQGGFEYMRNPDWPWISGLYTPPFELEQKGWGANGLFVADGDVLNGGLALAGAVKMLLGGDRLWESLRREGRKAAEAYSEKERRAKVAALWPELLKDF